jgi:hypothetical protein
MGFVRKTLKKVDDVLVRPVVKTVESIVENPAALAGVALSVAAPGVGTAIGSALGASGAAATAIGNAVIGGTLAEASGGDFAKGALGSAIGSIGGSVISPAISKAIGGTAGNIVASSLTPGLIAELQGGDFTQAAIQGAALGGINAAKASAITDYLKANPLADDYTVNVDYSLGAGASGEPTLTTRPIDTTYNVGSFDYSLGNLLSGLGLDMPSVPNVETMGGGQGIILKTTDGYVTESGFIPNSYVSSLGDPESFINKPVIDTGLSTEQLKDTSASDLNKLVAGLDVASALTPFALAALMKGVYDVASDEDATSGFAIVPVPTDWKSPTYSQQPWTAPEPIDFGSAALLKGTQWENPTIQQQQPYELSDIINSMNYASVPFVQKQYNVQQAPLEIADILQTFNAPSTVGVNDIIGNLNGQPMSIADIVSGIQSGQTYTSAMG